MMSSKLVSVSIATGRYLLAGSLDSGGYRILELLIGTSTEFIRISDVAVFHGSQAEPVVQLDEAIVRKAEIDCVLLLEQEHETPVRRRFAFVEKDSHGAFVLFSDHQLSGTVQWKGSVDPVAVLQPDASAFFPVCDAVLKSAHGSEAPITARVALVNRAKVSLLMIDKRVTCSSGSSN